MPRSVPQSEKRNFCTSAFRELLSIKRAMTALHKPKCLSKIIIPIRTKHNKGPSTQVQNGLLQNTNIKEIIEKVEYFYRRLGCRKIVENAQKLDKK